MMMKKKKKNIGFSFSPGGLLLPYHLGVASCLQERQFLDPERSILGGSSAGAIAIATIGCGLNPVVGLEGTIAISDICLDRGMTARGNLLPLLNQQMESLIDDENFNFLQQRQLHFNQQQQERIDMETETNKEMDTDDTRRIGTGAYLAYKEIFPQRKSHFQDKFDSKEDLFRVVGYSCMFPFFTTNFPFIIDTTNNNNSNNNNGSSSDGNSNRLQLPRFVMDGYFALPREQFGCPIFEQDNVLPTNNGSSSTGQNLVDRTVAITCIPQEIFGMEDVFNTNTNNNNLISISTDDDFTISDIFRIATMPSSRKELTDLYERGYRDGEQWCHREEKKKYGS